MSVAQRPSLGAAFASTGRPVASSVPVPGIHQAPDATDFAETDTSVGPVISPELIRSLAAVKGQAQFLLYLADQIEDSLDQLVNETDQAQGNFLCKILGMYSAQLESKHQGLGDKIAETCQEVYVTVREYDVTL
jgi:hypothetical protein